jgi:sulfate/thiosulfate transport system permease protein
VTFSATAGFLPLRRRSAIPGLGLTLSVTALYLALIVAIPLGALLAKASGLGLMGIAHIAVQPRVAAALGVSFGVALAAAFLSALVGVPIAWALARYRFPASACSTRLSTCPSLCRRLSQALLSRRFMRRTDG